MRSREKCLYINSCTDFTRDGGLMLGGPVLSPVVNPYTVGFDVLPEFIVTHKSPRQRLNLQRRYRKNDIFFKNIV